MASRRARLALGACAALLLGGLAGLAWWAWRHRGGRRPAPGRFRRARAAATAAGLAIIVVGSAWRLGTLIRPVPECQPPGGPLAGGPLTAAVVAEKVATWPETGIGTLYSQVTGARVCYARQRHYYVALNERHIAGDSAMTIGDIVMKPTLQMPRDQLRGLVEHESVHRTQWAVATVVAGPVAFPVAYAITNFFFPGARNPFERAAGLERGFYTPAGTGPVLGPGQLGVLAAAGAVLAVVSLRVAGRRRRGLRSARRGSRGRRASP